MNIRFCLILAIFSSLDGLMGALNTEQTIENAVNALRDSQSLPILQMDPEARQIAREHSREMAKSGEISHSGYQERADRLKISIYRENVGSIEVAADPLYQVYRWNHSTEHRENMLARDITKIAAGTYVRSGRIYCTLVLFKDAKKSQKRTQSSNKQKANTKRGANDKFAGSFLDFIGHSGKD